LWGLVRRGRGVTDGARGPDPTFARLFARFAVTGLVAMIVIGAISFVVVRRSATSNVIRQAKELTQLAGRGIAQPVITEGVIRGVPADLARLDRIVQHRILSGTPIVRVKIWDERGRIVYSDDSRLVGSTFALGAEELRVLRDGGVEAATTANGREAVTMALETSPDVVLMDLEMPELNGIEATRELIAADPSARVVILTTFSDRENIMGAIDAGALGYLLKDAEPEEIIRGVRSAARGDSPLAPRAAREMITQRSEAAVDTGLSARETEVLALVGEGLQNKLIARRLEISEKTVKAHLTSVFAQIGVSDRTQAALWARRHNITR
jgi:DNA-binding NarL/FixJ family response regulator